MAVYTLTAGADVFPSGQDVSGDDEIYGLQGDDILDGGAGADLLDGGEGFDIVRYASATAGIWVNPMSQVPRNDGTGDRFVSIERFELTAFNDYFRTDQSFASGVEIDGGAGDDRISATGGDDVLAGGEGNDDLRGSDGSDAIHGGAGSDLLDGGGGQDEIHGGDGDDLIQSGTNSDRVDGGAGIDTMILYGDPSQYQLSLLSDGSVQIYRLTPEYEQAGTVKVNGSTDIVTNVERLRYYDGTIFDLAAWIAAGMAPPGYQVVRGTDGGDTLLGSAAQDAIYGLLGNDSLSGDAGNDLLIGGGGADAFDGGEGVDTVSYRSAASAVMVNGVRGPFDTADPSHEAYGDTFTAIERIELTALDDSLYWNDESGITVLGHEGRDTLVGGVGGDSLDGGDADDVVNGADGNDVLRGGAGNDFLSGGAGDDLLDGGLGADRLHGGDGRDTVTFAGRGQAVEIGTGAGEDSDYSSIEAFVLTDHDDRIRLPSSRGEDGVSPASLSDVFAGTGNDFVDGGPIAGSLYGEDGNDTLIAAAYGSALDGGAGDDLLHSGIRSDLIEGGDGTDIVFYDRPREEYLIERDGDAIIVAHVDSGWVDRVTGVETLSFPHPVFLERVEIDTASIGAPPAATALRAGTASADSMAGDTGENILFSLDADDEVFGRDAADMLSGGGGDDRLFGEGGNDDLHGGDGTDLLDGGIGSDVMTGGSGDDVYVVDDAGDVVVERDGEGVDEVRSSLGNRNANLLYVLPAFIEAFSGTGSGQAVIDNALSNTIVLGAGHDLIVASAGGDEDLRAGGGNDFIYFGQAWTAGDRTDGGAGTDTIGLAGQYSLTLAAHSLVGVERLALYTADGASGAPASYVITTVDASLASGANLFVTGAGLFANEAITFNGAAETNGSFTVIAGAGADILAGGAGNDQLNGGSGADRLYGGGGLDVLTGGTGGDLLHGGPGGDRFVYASPQESSGAGFDRLQGFEFASDRIDLPTEVSGWTGSVRGRLSSATFDADVAAAVDGALQGHSAVFFRPDSGNFAGRIFAVVDANGDGVYQSGADYLLEFFNPATAIPPAPAIFV